MMDNRNTSQQKSDTNKNSFLESEILKNVAEGIYLTRLKDGIIVYTNERFEKMFGYGPGEMIGKPVAIVNAPTDKSSDEIKEDIVGILNKTGEWHGEIENIKKDGTRFWCYANASIFDHPEYGKVIVSVHTDITDRKKAEQELAQKVEETERLNKLMVDREIKMVELKKEIESQKSTINSKNTK